MESRKSVSLHNNSNLVVEKEREIEDLRLSQHKASSKLDNVVKENESLKEKIARLENTIKKMNYKDLLESKLNATVDNGLNDEIRKLQRKLKKVTNQNQHLTMELSRAQSSFNTSLINQTVDDGKKLLEAEERNIKLMTDLKRAKDKIKRLERGPRENMGGD